MSKRVVGAIGLAVVGLVGGVAAASAGGSSTAADPPVTAYSSGAPGVPKEDLDNPPPQEAAQAEATQGVNARGESYGSGLPALSPEEEPDLIAAVATNGQSGYVRASELEAADPGVERPEDAANYSGPNRASVPVYKSDGVTVIGHFDLTGDER